MNEELKQQVETIVKEIIRQQFDEMIANDRFLFKKNIQLGEGINIITGARIGAKIGSSALDKIGFFGVTPAVQQVKEADPTGGAVADAQARGTINSIINKLENLGLFSST